MSSPNVDETIKKYEIFINDVLKKDLRLVVDQLTKLNMEISGLYQQQRTLKVLTDKTLYPDGFKSQVNLGCNFFMEATVPDTSKMLFNIGLDCYLEFTLPEAENYLNVLIKAYEGKADELRNKAVATKAHIKMMLIGIDELMNENKKS